MNTRALGFIRATAKASDFMFRRLGPLYVPLYDVYKRFAERDALAWIRRVVRPGDRVVDVGANIGFYAEQLARCVGPSGRVDAFEPDAVNYRHLLKRARAYPQIRAVRAAVSERPGSIDLYLSPDLNIDHRTYPTGETRATVSVDAVSLDSLFTADERVQFIKIDIQGAEAAAFRGMQAVVARAPDVRILMELWPYVHDRFGGGTAALLALLDSWGFETRRLGAGGHPGARLLPDTVLPEREDPNAYFDVVCVRHGSAID